jgi:hypothetical protein
MHGRHLKLVVTSAMSKQMKHIAIKQLHISVYSAMKIPLYGWIPVSLIKFGNICCESR